MIDRNITLPLLGIVLLCASGCGTASTESSSSPAFTSAAKPESTMVVTTDAGSASKQSWTSNASGDKTQMAFTSDASAAQNWTEGGNTDKPKMKFTSGKGVAVTGDFAPPKGVTLPKGMSFSSRKPGNGKVAVDLDKEVPQLSAADQIRYNNVAVKLVMAINDEDSAAYRALFTDECWKESIAWWREMFSAQTSIYGRIARAYAPRRGFLKFGGMVFRGDLGSNEATIVVHFEEPFGAALTIALNKEGLISRTNIYAKQELAFLDPGEDKIIFQLDE